MQMSMCVRTEHVRARGFISTSLTLPLHPPHLPPLPGSLQQAFPRVLKTSLCEERLELVFRSLRAVVRVMAGIYNGPSRGGTRGGKDQVRVCCAAAAPATSARPCRLVCLCTASLT